MVKAGQPPDIATSGALQNAKVLCAEHDTPVIEEAERAFVDSEDVLPAEVCVWPTFAINQRTNEYIYINNPPAEWKCHFFHKKGQKIHYWTSGKRCLLEPVNPKWSFILRAGLDKGENGWQLFLSDKGSWMKNKETGEFFLTKSGFSQSVTVSKGFSQWQQGICSDKQGHWIHYWFFEHHWFLEPQPSKGEWIPPWR